MNQKRIAALALMSALAASVTPAMAANPTVNVTIKWNTQSLSSLTVTSNYTNTGAMGASAGTIFANLNGGAGICSAAAGSNVAQTVDFGNVTPDAVKYTDCNFNNGANAQYSTNDSLGYSLTVQETTAATHDANKLLCYLPNGSQTAASPVVSTRTSNALTPSIIAVTQTDATCSAAVAGAVAIKAASASTITSAAAATAGVQNAGGDIELVLQPNAPSGADQTTATWTLVLN